MEHIHQSIPGWAAFASLYVDVVKRFPTGSRFIEVGSWLGKSAALMAVEIENSGKDIEFVCVDPWKDGGPDLRDTKYFKELTAPPYELFVRNTAQVAHRIKALRMTSAEASRWFPDGSVDFIMLDGDHSYAAVKDDIELWLPKMKRGGIMSGDDYTWPGVEQAVKEAFAGRFTTVINGAPGGEQRRKADYRKDSSYWMVQL